MHFVNLRLPLLDLDSVYGAVQGPQDADAFAAGIYEADKIHLALGRNAIAPPAIPPDPNIFGRERIPDPALDKEIGPDGLSIPRRDLPRHDPQTADGFEPKVGDTRNDENLVIAQFHTAFLHFHNAVVSWLDAHPAVLNNAIFTSHDKFSVARQLVVWSYQWLVVNDYLLRVAMPQIVHEIEDSESTFFADGEFMPLEFSVAGYRFGHSMIRNRYDYNMNFGERGDLDPSLNPLLNTSTLEQLFHFTGKREFKPLPTDGFSTSTLPVNWIIEWDRFTHIDPAFPVRSAQKIDTNLAGGLAQLSPTGTDLAKHLARRNLLRCYLLNIPTAQHVADYLGVKPLTKELLPTNKQGVIDALVGGDFDIKTPLWYYILREAEVQTNGESLGQLGSKLVAGTLIGLIKADPNSYINKGWDPSHETAVKLPGDLEIRSISQFFQFAGVAPIEQVAALAAD